MTVGGAFAADTGFSFGDTYATGLLFLGLAVFAAIGALSHQRERAFSASLIYLGLGVSAAVATTVLGLGWLEPLGDAELVQRAAELAVVIALFSAGLKLDRPLALARVGLRRAPARDGDAPHDRRGGAVRHPGARALARRGGRARSGAGADRPGARGRHRRRPAGRRGRSRAELRADRRGRPQRRPGVPVRAARAVLGRGRRAAGASSGCWPTSPTRSPAACWSAPRWASGSRGRSSACATTTC